MVKYAFKSTSDEKVGKSKCDDCQVSYKRTYGVLRAVKGMQVDRAQEYLDRVLQQKDVVPVTKFWKGAAHTEMAHKWGYTAGKYPTKSTIRVQGLIKQATKNYLALNTDANQADLYIKDVFCGLSGQMRHRRNYRAHGSVNQYNSEPCHIQVIVAKRQQPVKAALAK